MAKRKDDFTQPITLEYIQLNYKDIAKVLFIDYASMDEEMRKTALWEFVKHYFFNTGEESLELFRKKNPMAAMLFDMLDKGTEQQQVSARWASFENFYRGDDTLTIDDVFELKAKERKAKKKEANKQAYQRRKQIDAEKYLEDNKRRDKENLELLKHELNNREDS